MSNYRRLISYIYAYEGGVKGKNIGFAKLETRNGQCRIQVSVRKVFIGGQDMGVFLLSSDGEIFLGRIFLRNGAGEFRTSVAVDHVAGSEKSIDQCYGMTIHNMEDSWQNYTTIWEDAVAHAAEVELEEAVSELAEEQEMSHAPESVISEEKLEEVVTNHKSSIVENIEAEIQAQNQKKEVSSSSQNMEEEIPSTFVQPRKEEPQKILWPKEELENGEEEPSDKKEQSLEQESSLSATPQERVEQEIPSQSQAQGHMENVASGEQVPNNTDHIESSGGQFPNHTDQGTIFDGQLSDNTDQEKTSDGPFFGCASQEMPSEEQQIGKGDQGIISLQGSQSGNRRQGITLQEQPSRKPTGQTHSQSQSQPIRRVGFQGQPRQQPFQGYFSRRPIHGMPQQDQYYQPMPQAQPTTTSMPQPIQEQPLQPVMQPGLEPPMQPAQGQLMQPVMQLDQGQPMQPVMQPAQGQPMQPAQGQPMQPVMQPAQEPSNWSQRQPSLPEKEDTKEGMDMESLWQRFCKMYPKIQAFDYDGTSEILTIKPQDIGLLPREIWTYGNNSFLLHGYYNHHYLILARLVTQNGGIRFLLGVPGHYYSNEKYMASMFGFPNFVMSKSQPSGDNRFGYWYTDLRLGF